ncbi:hypothetical protein FRC12_009155 [Ceratobasidium sp. 428]|nr:hypothetical protein FRC12_009155 [Ceratobasidium sp. 428]
MIWSNLLAILVPTLLGIHSLAAPVPLPVNASPSLQSIRASSFSVVALLEKAQSRMNQVLAQASNLSVLDLPTINDIVSTTNDVSNTLATDLQTLDPSLDTLMVDATGNKLTERELAIKVGMLLKGFETACVTAKDTYSGEIANIMELIAQVLS